MTEEESTAYPHRRARWEAALALAMLPTGVVLGLATALASAVLLAGAVVALLLGATWWLVLWCAGGGLACAWIAVTAIGIVSAFDWRPLPRVLAVAALVVAACPFWW